MLLLAERKARYDKFGEEGLKGGVPTADNEFLEGYSFHGDAKRVFRDFFGGDNPFSGTYLSTTGCTIPLTTPSPLELFNFDTVDIDGYSAFSGLKGRSQPKQDPPIERDLVLTLEEIYSGCIKKMKISRKVVVTAYYSGGWS